MLTIPSAAYRPILVSRDPAATELNVHFRFIVARGSYRVARSMPRTPECPVTS
jgi:hypothetical protein